MAGPSGPCLYSKDLFDVLDGRLPTDWLRVEGDDGDWYLDLPLLAARGFYERSHDGDPDAMAVFAQVYLQLEAAQ